jgi:hypothetical protein
MYELRLEKQTISEILAKNFSEYFLPSIQREFVWDEDDIKELIESILKGYPIGIIIMFKTELDFPSIPIIDTTEKNTNKEKYYILDGQQRLTSLLLIRDKWELKRNGEIIKRTPIFFNPDDKKLRIKGKREYGYDFASLVNMCIFRETPKEYLQKTLEYIRKNFLDRPIAFYIIEVKKTETAQKEIYKDMAQIFTRINKAGVRLGNLEMFLSFFASASVGKDDINKLHKELNHLYSMDLEPIIRFVFSNLKLSQHQISKIESFNKALEEIEREYNDTQIKEIINNSKKSITVVMELLKNSLGITNTQILPSENVLVPLFKYVYNKKIEHISQLPDEEIRKMIKWFILASYHGLYSSKTDTRLENDFAIIDNSVSFPLENLLESMYEKIKTKTIEEKDFKNIDINILRGVAGKKYLFILYILLVKNNATDWTGFPLAHKLSYDIVKHHIFPKDELKERDEKEENINHIGNLTFIDKGKNEELQNILPEKYLQDLDPDVLQKHFIPDDKKLWKIDNYDSFLDERTNLIWQAFESFMKSL